MFRKLPRFIQRLLHILGMAPEPPKIRGLFTALERSTFGYSPIEDWYATIRECEATLDCSVSKVGWHKNLSGKEEHEFLQFDILSPDKKHVAIVIAERCRGGPDPTNDAAQPTGGVAPLDTSAGSVTPPFAPPETATVVDTQPDVPGESTASSADESSLPSCKVNKANGKRQRKDKDSARITSSFASSSSQRYANDHVSWATRDSQTGDQLKQKYGKAARICTLTFSENAQPSAHELATLVHVTSKLEPKYSINETQCYWFAETVFDALNTLFKDAVKDPKNHRGGTWARVPIHTKESVDVVCARYRAARAALLEEIEQQRRLKREQEEERQQERQQRQAAEEAMKWEREQREVAEENAKAADETAKREREQREAAEAANMKLLQELEAFRRATARNSLSKLHSSVS
ncbi:hypothetical protein BKA82DRAFT_4240979 [Pisolithus tinctorius]|nr:hypothetical protein BKA82DRAFT_4240979 [Pisolithus tinctorius]